MAFNYSTRAQKIAADALGERARLLLTKEGTDVKLLQERATLEEIPFSLKSNTPYDLPEKHSVLSTLTWADAHTPTKLFS